MAAICYYGKRYGNNKMAAMRIMSLILHLQQYSPRLNLLYFFLGFPIKTMPVFPFSPIHAEFIAYLIPNLIYLITFCEE